MVYQIKLRSLIKQTSKVFLLTILFLFSADTYAQDPELSQFYAASLYTNPAMAGAAKNIRLGISARNQYTGLTNNYRTGVAALDAYIPRAKSGLGLLSMYDVAGDGFLTTTSVAAVYAFHAQINRDWGFNAAVQGGLVQKRFDFNKFIFEDMIDPVRGPVLPTKEVAPQENVSFMNFGTGILFYGKQMFAGLAVHNLTEPNQSFYYQNADSSSLKLPRRYTLHAGVNIPLNNARYEEDQVSISPNILFMQQRNFFQMNAGFYVKQKALTLGAWYRQTSKNADAFIVMAGLKLSAFKIGYSYDAVISKAATTAVGSHELSLIIELKPVSNNRRFSKALKCPQL
jgi:type IX secretion system PorP/SprF family membrane protein